MYRHVYNKGVTGGTEGDILGKLPRKRANLVNPTVVDFCNVHTQPCILPLKTGWGKGRKSVAIPNQIREGVEVQANPGNW